MHRFFGTIVKGRGNGKYKLGFATANMLVEYKNTDVLIRRSECVGAWTVRVHLPANAFNVNEKYLTRPNRVKLGFVGVSVKAKALVFEIHIIDFDGDLYGKEVGIDLLEKIREQIIFPSVEAAKEQIKKDYEFTMTKINEYKSCKDCKFFMMKDYGYSNYTVEGTDGSCLIDKHPTGTFDIGYNNDNVEFKHANKCDFYNPGECWQCDVDGETEAPSEDWIKTELRDMSIRIIEQDGIQDSK